jgi:hypothetical protein
VGNSYRDQGKHRIKNLKISYTMTQVIKDSTNAYNEAKNDFCTENNRNNNLNWDDLDEIFSCGSADDPSNDSSLLGDGYIMASQLV